MLSAALPVSLSRPASRQRGSTLLMVAGLLAALAAAAFALTYATQSSSDARLQQQTRGNLELADRMLQQFAAAKGRLPCPAPDGNGIEDCSMAKGYLPYLTLGLSGTGFQAGGIPMRYGVYRRSATPDATDADLAAKKDRFSPTNAHSDVPTAGNGIYVFGDKSALDLCTGLDNASGSAFSSGHTHIGSTNKAYVLALPGNSDRDGLNGLYDGLNGQSGAGFESEQKISSTLYDDTTLARGFDEIKVSLRCQTTQRSLDLMADAVATEEEVVLFAKSNESSAQDGLTSNAVASAIAVWQLAQAIAAVSAATEVSATSAALLATATAACPVPPFVTCAMIPLYTTAVSSAATGVALAATAAGLSGVALGLQLTATIMYGEVNDRTGAPDSGSGGAVSQADIDAAEQDYIDAGDALLAAQAAEQNARDALENALTGSGISCTDPSPFNVLTQSYSDCLQWQNSDMESALGVGATADQMHLLIDGKVTERTGCDPSPCTPPYTIDEKGAIPALNDYYKVKDNLASAEIAQSNACDPPANPASSSCVEATSAVNAINATITAKDTAVKKAQDLAIATEGCTITPPATQPAPGTCGLLDTLNDYLTSYESYLQKNQAYLQAKSGAERKLADKEAAYDTWQTLICRAKTPSEGYDSTNNACTGGSPDPGTSAVCDSSSPVYNAESCAALSASGGATPETYTTGAKDILELLDGKGAVE